MKVGDVDMSEYARKIIIV